MTCEFQKEEEPAPVSDDKSDDDVYKLKDDEEEKPESPKKMKKEIKRTPKVRFVSNWKLNKVHSILIFVCISFHLCLKSNPVYEFRTVKILDYQPATLKIYFLEEKLPLFCGSMFWQAYIYYVEVFL